ncbi:MAG: ABC transporter ATP-binding protein [Rikenellaceae bacterium]
MATHKITLSAKGLHIGYRLKKRDVYSVHTDLTLNLRSGEVTSLLGLNGAGKSTLIRTLCGFQPPIAGEVMLLDRDITSYTQREISRTIGVVLTEKSNAGGITVYDLVTLGRHPHTGFFGGLSSHDHAIVEESLDAVGISHKSQNYVSELSDGERQKVMIAKALAQQCPIIILDEPTAFLDVTSRIETMVLLRKLAIEQGKTILLSTHDLDMAIQMSDSLWLQKKGEPLLSGTPEDLILNGQLSTFFNRDEIKFDISTGKLNIPQPNNPIGIEGDFLTSFWVGNALVRVGFKPALSSLNYPLILCHSSNNIEIKFTNGEVKIVSSVAELIEQIYSSILMK